MKPELPRVFVGTYRFVAASFAILSNGFLSDACNYVGE
ncbi:hypothetical protein [Methylomonas albis]|nr:hypothetical protein [Methylomonas albis]